MGIMPILNMSKLRHEWVKGLVQERSDGVRQNKDPALLFATRPSL